jgi:hypothetical protein
VAFNGQLLPWKYLRVSLRHPVGVDWTSIEDFEMTIDELTQGPPPPYCWLPEQARPDVAKPCRSTTSPWVDPGWPFED